MTAPTLPQSSGWMGDPRRGAALGRASTPAKTEGTPRKFYLQRVRINSQGYDSGGAYWGLGAPLYWATCDGVDCYLRASSREAAKAEVSKRYPGATFYR